MKFPCISQQSIIAIFYSNHQSWLPKLITIPLTIILSSIPMPIVLWHPERPVSRGSLSVPETWNQHVNDIVNRSRSERAVSRKLREEIGTSLAQIAQYLSDHWNDVNAALAERIREVTEARNQLQASLGHVSCYYFQTNVDGFKLLFWLFIFWE